MSCNTTVNKRTTIKIAGSRKHRAVAPAMVLRRQAPRRPAARGGGQDHGRICRAGHRQLRAAAAQLVAPPPPRPRLATIIHTIDLFSLVAPSIF